MNTLSIRSQGSVTFICFDRASNKNAITAELVTEMHRALDDLDPQVSVVVLEGSVDYFCNGADFSEVSNDDINGVGSNINPSDLYDLWTRLCFGPFISIAHVEGVANAGGMGFVAACDIVIASDQASFALPEMLFDLEPACVMPFMARKVGASQANFMTLTTKPISGLEAKRLRLVDECETRSKQVLQKYVRRVALLSPDAVKRHKRFMRGVSNEIEALKSLAIETNEAVFSDPVALQKVQRFQRDGVFPWEI